MDEVTSPGLSVDDGSVWDWQTEGFRQDHGGDAERRHEDAVLPDDADRGDELLKGEVEGEEDFWPLRGGP